MSLPAKRGRPILPKVRTKTASVMMVVDGCGNPLVKIELFHLFFFTGLKTDRSSGGKNHRTYRKKRSRKEHGDPPDARPCKSGERNDRTLWKTDHRDHTAGPKIGVSLAESGFNGQFTIAELLGTITGNVPGQAGIFAVSIAVVLISYGISIRFMEKREI